MIAEGLGRVFSFDSQEGLICGVFYGGFMVVREFELKLKKNSSKTCMKMLKKLEK
jgi:hypothetical protein